MFTSLVSSTIKRGLWTYQKIGAMWSHIVVIAVNFLLHNSFNQILAQRLKLSMIVMEGKFRFIVLKNILILLVI